MKRLLLGVVVIGTLAAAIGLSRQPGAASGTDLQIQVEERNPWTDLRMNNDPLSFGSPSSAIAPAAIARASFPRPSSN